VRCYGGSTKKGDLFIVTELMEASVYDLIHDQTFNFSHTLKLDIAISTAKAMSFLHGCGLIHRDLKSLNLLVPSFPFPLSLSIIFFLKVNKDFIVKICDFGLSRIIDTRSTMTCNIGLSKLFYIFLF